MTKKQLDRFLDDIEAYIDARIESAMVHATLKATDSASASLHRTAELAGRRERRQRERMVRSVQALTKV